MDNEKYTYKKNHNEIVVCRNEKWPSRWDVWINDKLVRAAFYESPEEAALCASIPDFSDDELNRLFSRLKPLADLHYWHHDTCPAMKGR